MKCIFCHFSHGKCTYTLRIPIKAKELNHFKKYNMLFIKENYIRLKQFKIYFANYKKIKVGVSPKDGSANKSLKMIYRGNTFVKRQTHLYSIPLSLFLDFATHL